MDSFNGEFLSIAYVKQESDSHAVPCYAEVNTMLSAFIQQLNYSVFNLFTAVTRKKMYFFPDINKQNNVVCKQF